MNAKTSNPSTVIKLLDRSDAVSLLQTAISTKQYRFGRQLASKWLEAYRGDLLIKRLYAQILYADGRPEDAIKLLAHICLHDPEDISAQVLLLDYQTGLETEAASITAASVQALGGELKSIHQPALWGNIVFQARQALSRAEPILAERLIQQAFIKDPSTPLAALTHLQILRRGDDWYSKHSMAKDYLDHWPDCLTIKLILTETLMESGQSEDAVALLHEVAVTDIAGQTARRLWGKNHAYRSLWLSRHSIELDIPIPAPIAAVLGWNQLPEVSSSQAGINAGPAHKSRAAEVIEELRTGEGVFDPQGESPQDDEIALGDRVEKESTHQETDKHSPIDDVSSSVRDSLPSSLEDIATPETVRSVETELARVADRLKTPHITRTDGRFPVYVVFTSRRGLETQYGPETAKVLDEEMKRLAETIRARGDWDAVLLYGDDPRSCASLGVKPAQPGDAWGLKLVLSDLDEALSKRGEMIGATLIVGGPQIIPFHHLPNPVDDEDVDVPSDNPYATRDENYFVPEWPVGRLPGDSGNDPGPLLYALRQIITRQNSMQVREPWYRRIWHRILAKIWPRRNGVHPSLGYTAEIWRRASISVFRPIGEGRSLLVSPPIMSADLSDDGLTPARLGYFNLHGLEDTAYWYGQKDPVEKTEGPDYPIALRPEDLRNGGRAPKVVFSEACYGAHIINKSIDSALALKFLTIGTEIVVGSTSTSYGSVTTPLFAADLLGKAFWKFLREGLPAAEALRRAKIFLAREMHRRQGYLDGEDQKTLISFVLYGDPLAQPIENGRHAKKIVRNQRKTASVKTVCDRCNDEHETREHPAIPADILTQVKGIVEQYLPGMADAALRLSQEHAGCEGNGHVCPSAQLGAKAVPQHAPQRRVIVLSKHVERAANVHHHYARITLDKDGRLVKLAVSR